VSALKAIAPPSTPRLAEVSIDPRVLAFAAALTLCTAVIFGIVPAWQASRETLTPALNQGGRSQPGDGGGRVRRWLIVAELALALMLLVGAGLLVRTFMALQAADLGFNPDHVLSGFVLPPGAVYKTDAQRRAFYDRVLERAGSLPGVKAAALTSVTPLGGDNDTDFQIEGRPKPRTSAEAVTVWYRNVSANYFSVMAIPLKHGRLFTPEEAEPVAVVNEAMAKRYWPADDAIGHRLTLGNSPPLTIIGVVGNVAVRGPRESARDELYVPYWENPEAGAYVVLKTAVDPASLIEPLKRALAEVDHTVALSGTEPLAVTVANANGPSRFYALLVAAFAALALALASVGVYGVMSFAVSQRTPEIGVRLALGAGQRQIFELIIGDSVKLAAGGLAIGAAGAIAVGRALRTLLYGIGGTDPATFAAMAAVLVGIALLATYLPARRAMRVDPMRALRIE
jgi:putative ABC transport system permease protein